MNARPDSGSFNPSPTLLASLIHHYDELVAYVRSRFGRTAFAQDVVHNVCLRLLERPEPNNVRQPLALLRRISHDAAIDLDRSEQTRRRLLEDNPCLIEGAACPGPGQLQQAEGREALHQLIDAIHAMPLRRQQVFVLHKIHDVPQREVAVLMGISLKMVEKHLRLAMDACRQRLERG